MASVHVLVDLENNQPTLDEVRRLVPDLTDAWLFHSQKQAKHLASFAALGERHTRVPITRPGKNALDFHLAFYVGYIAARNPDAKLVVVAIDRGYRPMVEHARTLGFQVTTAAHRPAAAAAGRTAATKAPGATTASKVAAKKKPAVKKPAKPASVKSPTTVAKAAVPAPSAAAKAAPAKVPAAKLPAGDSAVVSTPAVTARPRPAADKVIASLRKMGDKRPKKLEQLRRHLASMLGTAFDDRAVDSLLGVLFASDAVRGGAALAYGPAVTAARGSAGAGGS